MSLKTQLKKRTADHVDLVFCMDRPLVKELEAARAEDRAKSKDKDSAYSSAKKSDRVKELEKRSKDASVTIRISSLPWVEYNELMTQHPAREGHDEQFNSSTFFEAVAKATAVEVTAKSTLPIHDEDWQEFVDGLTDGEYDRLAGAVLQVNRNMAAVDIAPLG